MLCPKCGETFQIMWRDDWFNSKCESITSVVGHCGNCDFDGTWDIDEEGNEINFRQYFFG